MNIAPKTHTKSTSLRLPKNLYDRLHERARAEDRSVASLMRIAAEDYLRSAKRRRRQGP